MLLKAHKSIDISSYINTVRMSVKRAKTQEIRDQMCEKCADRASKKWTGVGRKSRCETCQKFYEGLGGGCPKCAETKKICRSCHKTLAD